MVAGVGFRYKRGMKRGTRSESRSIDRDTAGFGHRSKGSGPRFKEFAPITLLIAGFLIAAAGAVHADASPLVVRARDHGAVPDVATNSGPALRRAIQAALAAGSGSEVVLEAGTYRVGPDAPRGTCLPLNGVTNLTLRGAGAATKLIVTDPEATAVNVSGSQRVTLRDFSLDYDPLPFCQGVVRAIDQAAGHFDLEVEAGYPTPDATNFIRAAEPYGKWGMIMDPAVRRIRAGTSDHFMTPRWEHREGRVWRFFTQGEHYRYCLQSMRPGDAYVHLARGNGCAVFAHGNDGVRVENVTVYASPGLVVGLVANRGELVVRGLQVRFAPGTTRLLTANADGVHCQQNRAGPVIEDCYFEGMADDAINMYAPPNVLRTVHSPTHWAVSAGAFIAAGDRLQVLDPKTGRVRGEVKAIEVKPAGGLWELTLERTLDGVVTGEDHRTGDTLYNLDGCGAGFQIRRNTMHGNRRYGCLLRAGAGMVEDNLFEDTTGAGVVLTNEPDWPEGPVPWGITIRRNRFLRGGTCLGYAESPAGAALAVRGCRLGHGLAEGEAIHDVVIEQNEFRDRAGTAIYLGAARGVALRGNRILADAQVELRRQGGAIELEQASGVVLRDNEVADPRPGTSAAVIIHPSVAAGTNGVVLEGLKATGAATSKSVDDRRAAAAAK